MSTTASSCSGGTGNGSQLRKRSAFRPWKSPQSNSTRAREVSSRKRVPVTVRAAPRKRSVGEPPGEEDRSVGSSKQPSSQHTRTARAESRRRRDERLAHSTSTVTHGRKRQSASRHRSRLRQPHGALDRDGEPWRRICTGSCAGNREECAVEYIRPFDSLTLDDIPLVGGKNASLGEMIRSLDAARRARARRLRPDGATPTGRSSTGRACASALREALAALDPHDVDSLRAARRASRGAPLREAPLPAALLRELESAYAALSRQYGSEADGRGGALERHRRGSADRELRRPAGDLPQRPRRSRSWSTPAARCFASLFTDRAISYRAERGFDHEKVYLSIGVQKMVRSDRAGSGVIFTLDTESGFDRRGARSPRSTGSARTSCRASRTRTSIWCSSRRCSEISAAPRLEGDRDGLRRGRRAQARAQRRGARVAAAPVRALARGGRRAGAPGASRSRSTTASAPASDGRWTSSGRRTGATGELFIVQARPETVHAQPRRRQARDATR